MPIVDLNEILPKAQAEKYAVGAFNVENMEMVQAVVDAAEKLRSPVIIQTTPSTLKYAEPKMFVAMVRAKAESSSVPVVLHLDHGSSYELAEKAFRAGYSSLMIDGSKLGFRENVALTLSVAELCRGSGVSVEAEIGCIGGKEDSLSARSIYTEPSQAKEFYEQTKVDALAVAIGTAHGIYKSTPSISVERLAQIRRLISVPLVLHGTSGVDDDVVRACIENGICKVNYATDLRIAYTAAVREILADEGVFDPKKYQSAGRDAVTECVMHRIKVCGSGNKAPRA